ncbi:MAG: xanthine dehydrogenase family protein subunit M, partial [Halobacteriaceae archaeon]
IPLRIEEAESIVEGTSLTDGHLSDVADVAIEAADPEAEQHADVEFKEEVAGEYARRALERAYERVIDQ